MYNIRMSNTSSREKKEKSIYDKPRFSSALIQRLFGSRKLKSQIYTSYLIALIIPVLIVGLILIISTSSLLKGYHQDLTASDNLRVKATFYEITTESYYTALSLSDDATLLSLISAGKEKSRQEYEAMVDAYMDDKSYAMDSSVRKVRIYVGEDMPEYRLFSRLDSSNAILNESLEREDLFWRVMVKEDEKGEKSHELALLYNLSSKLAEGERAVLVITIDENYLRERVESSDFETMVLLEDESVCYASDRKDYESTIHIPISFDNSHYSYKGDIRLEDKKVLVNVVTQFMYQSTSRLYICTINNQVYPSIQRIITLFGLILILAIVIPGVMVVIYAQYFSERMGMLRNEMHKASQGDYSIVPDFRGGDEISDAFRDLETMVEMIQQKDAEMYRSSIDETELKRSQQQMEFKMLAAQINPHFLYNTLESIRMKAFTAGDREVAGAIKLLGKSLRYVLDNTGTALTTLEKELEYVETYIAIQRFRFGNKISYEKELAEGIVLSKIEILPLLLQPIVENSILHGLEDKEEGGMIRVHIYTLGDYLRVDVSDNGCGMDGQRLQALRASLATRNPDVKESIGLYNINQRLKLSYGSRYGLQINSREGFGTTVMVLLPIPEEKM